MRKGKSKTKSKTTTTRLYDSSHNNALEVERLMISAVDDIYNLFD
jgi:hypothetical protein